MKKLLLGSIILTLFSVSLLVFQVSCKKEVNAQTTSGAGITQLNLIVFAREISNSVSFGSGEIWLANLDGSNQHKVTIILPGAYLFGPRLSPDGKTIIFNADLPAGQCIYSCAIDGSNLKKLVSGTNTAQYIWDRATIGGAY